MARSESGSATIPVRPRNVLIRSALKAMGEGVTLVDQEGRIVYSNPAADRLLGIGPTTAPPDTWAAHFGVLVPGTEEPFPTHEYPLVRALAGEETDGVEMLIRNPAIPRGALISATGRPVRDDAGRILGAAVIFRDVTRLRAAQRDLRSAVQQLEESQRAKEELLAFLVHDMKGPLTAITAGAELLLMQGGLSGDGEEGIMDILDSARALHGMVLNMLDVQAAEDGRLEPEPEPVPVRAVLEPARAGAKARGASVTVEVAGAPVLLGDPGLLRRIVANLVDNCIRYGSEGGRIWLEAHATGTDRVLLRVRDEGPGIPPELRKRIFEKYTRVERGVELRRDGSRGLGLRFCQVAVEAHEGRIWVEDNEPVGAMFCVELPAA